jgi:hypothetical protein
MASQINLDTAQRVDITCRKGDSFRLEITFRDTNNESMDLTGYEWKLDVRETDTSSQAIIEDTEFSYDGNSSGLLVVEATPNTMAAIDGGIYVYDLQSTNAGSVKTWLYGIFKVNEDVTL